MKTRETVKIFTVQRLGFHHRTVILSEVVAVTGKIRKLHRSAVACVSAIDHRNGEFRRAVAGQQHKSMDRDRLPICLIANVT